MTTTTADGVKKTKEGEEGAKDEYREGGRQAITSLYLDWTTRDISRQGSLRPDIGVILQTSNVHISTYVNRDAKKQMYCKSC